MKLITPPLEINKENPFANDVLDRKDYGEALLNLVVNSDDALVIALDAKWGEGKTTFVKMWQGLLHNANVPNIYIDAFANDYVDDAFVSVASAITSYAQENIEKTKETKITELKEKTKKVGGQLLSLTAQMGLKIITLDIVKDTHLDAIKDELSKNASELVGNFIEERINSHSQDIELIESFKKLLSELPSQLKENEANNPLIIIIDELDRCKPTYAVELIEKIKHLFSVENVVFLLVMNKEQLENSISSVYGDIDAHTYLQKFVNLDMKLPKVMHERHINDIRKYINRLSDVHKLKAWDDKNALLDSLEQLANHFNLSLRQLERVFSVIVIFYSSSTENQIRIPDITVFLAILKTINSNLFDQILYKKTNFDAVLKELDLSDLNKDSFYYWDLQWVRFALLSEDEFSKLDDKNQFQHYLSITRKYNLQRKDLLPFFAKKLNAFSISK